MNQGILHNTIDKGCSCCEEIWLQLAESANPVLHYEPNLVVNLASVVWQSNVASVWTDIQTGGSTIEPGNFAIDLLVRVKYVDALGCTHYSNMAVTF